MRPPLLTFRRPFLRYTDSAKRVIFYALHGAAARSASEIAPADLLLGLARDKHDEECGFRRLDQQHEELADTVGLQWPTSESLRRPVAPQHQLPLAADSKRILAHAVSEADRTKEFWIDTDHIQAGILVEDGQEAKALQQIGYTLPITRALGIEGRSKWPPKKPTLMQRSAFQPAFIWLAIGFIAGIGVAYVVSLMRAR